MFGDSNVDNGNLAAKGAAQTPSLVINPPPNFGGRNNNGPVVVEYLASVNGVADPNALNVYWAGSNNLIDIRSDAGAGQIVVANRSQPECNQGLG